MLEHCFWLFEFKFKFEFKCLSYFQNVQTFFPPTLVVSLSSPVAAHSSFGPFFLSSRARAQRAMAHQLAQLAASPLPRLRSRRNG
jgi:hypothetical protein